MTETDKAPARRSPLWMRIFLLVSLAVNLLIFGIIFGSVVSRGHGGGDKYDRLRGTRDLAPPPFVMALDGDDRQALVERFREEAAPFRRERGDLRRKLGSLLDALRADTFDADAVQQLLAGERNRSVGRQEAGEAILLEYLASLSAEGRRAYADRLETALKRRRR